MTDAESALFGEIDAKCTQCDRDMRSVRTDADNPIAVLRRVECPGGHTGTVEIRHNDSVAEQKGTIYHGDAVAGGSE